MGGGPITTTYLSKHLTIGGTDDPRLPGEAYVINQEFLSRGDNPARYEDVDLSRIDHSWNGDSMFSDTRVLILSDSCNLTDMPEDMLLKDVTNINLPGTTLQDRHRFARARSK